jgi:hypothetical protein
MAFELTIGPQEFLKNYFAEVDEVMFHNVERPFESIFCILRMQKSNLDDVASVMI